MPFSKTLERMTELDALLSGPGVDLDEVAQRWGIRPHRVGVYIKKLKYDKGSVASSVDERGRRIYRYQGQKPPRKTKEQKQEERKQKRRRDTLEKIRVLLSRLNSSDRQGVDWVLKELLKTI